MLNIVSDLVRLKRPPKRLEWKRESVWVARSALHSELTRVNSFFASSDGHRRPQGDQ